MDIEGFVRGRLTKGEDENELKSILAERIREFKDYPCRKNKRI